MSLFLTNMHYFQFIIKDNSTIGYTYALTLSSSYGLPDQIATDNKSQFTSSEFQNFAKANGIKHMQCSHHAPTNEEAEHCVEKHSRNQ